MKSGVQSLKYFYTIYLIKANLMPSTHFYRMSQSSSQHQLMISDWYHELMADPSLLSSSSEDKWMSIHGLPYLDTLWFHITLERLFTHLTSLALWGRARADFIPNASQRTTSTEITTLAILVMEGVGMGGLGMITAFCRTDQVKVKPSDMLSTLVQWDSPKSVGVVKVFTNSPYLPWQSFSSPYLDVTTFSDGTLTAKFPLGLLHLHWLLPYSSTQVMLPHEKEGDKVNISLFLAGTLWQSSEEEHHLSHLLPLSVPIISPHSNIDGRAQTKEALSFSLALRQLQEAIQAKAQLEWGLARELEGPMKDHEDQ